jgi:hypothetical protein
MTKLKKKTKIKVMFVLSKSPLGCLAAASEKKKRRITSIIKLEIQTTVNT